MRAAFDADQLHRVGFAGEFKLIRRERLAVGIDEDVDGAEVNRRRTAGSAENHEECKQTEQANRIRVARVFNPCRVARSDIARHGLKTRATADKKRPKSRHCTLASGRRTAAMAMASTSC